jgi:hypothetical protein
VSASRCEVPSTANPMWRRTALFALMCLAAGCATRVEPPVYAESIQRSTGTIAIIGDTQHTLSVERIFMGRERNDAEQPAIIADLVAHRPDVLVHLGDLVSDAGSTAAWTSFDELMKPVREAQIPILPVYGNHDYWVGRARAEQELCGRFPPVRVGHWYAQRFGRLLLVVLDSNINEFSREEWDAQRRWFAEQLDVADAEVSIAGVLVFAHHPPYTNSRVTGDEKHMQEAFVAPFASHRKTLAMFGGHAHAYEHFHIGRKTFVVCGGGGGPRVTLRQGADRRHEDLFTGPSPRPLHYVLLREDVDGVHVLVRGMDKSDPVLREVDGFTLPYAR